MILFQIREGQPDKAPRSHLPCRSFHEVVALQKIRGDRLLNSRISFDTRTYLCDLTEMKGAEFLRRTKKVAERTGREYRFVASWGKGSHGRLYLGSAFTAVKDPNKEIGPGLLRSMCRDLGISPGDL